MMTDYDVGMIKLHSGGILQSTKPLQVLLYSHMEWISSGRQAAEKEQFECDFQQVIFSFSDPDHTSYLSLVSIDQIAS